jgi:hypothetical protein
MKASPCCADITVQADGFSFWTGYRSAFCR